MNDDLLFPSFQGFTESAALRFSRGEASVPRSFSNVTINVGQPSAGGGGVVTTPTAGPVIPGTPGTGGGAAPLPGFPGTPQWGWQNGRPPLCPKGPNNIPGCEFPPVWDPSRRKERQQIIED